MPADPLSELARPTLALAKVASRRQARYSSVVRIQIDWRGEKGGSAEPRSFVLGQRRLWVARVLEQSRHADGRHFVVATTDRRRFLLCEDKTCAAWNLAAVHAADQLPNDAWRTVARFSSAPAARKARLAAYGAAIALPVIALWRLLRK